MASYGSIGTLHGIYPFPSQTSAPNTTPPMPVGHCHGLEYVKPYLPSASKGSQYYTAGAIRGLALPLPSAYSSSTSVYSISGTVSYAGSGVSGWNAIVIAEDANNALLGSATTGSGGSFNIPIVAYNGNVSVICYPPAPGSPSVDAQIFANVVPG